MLPKILISLAILLSCLSLKGQDFYPPKMPTSLEFLQIQEYKKKIDSLSEIIFERTLNPLDSFPYRYQAICEVSLIKTDKSITFLLENDNYVSPSIPEYYNFDGVDGFIFLRPFHYSIPAADGWHVLSRLLNLMRQKNIDDKAMMSYMGVTNTAITARRTHNLPSLKPIFEMELAMTSPYDTDPSIKIYRENLLRMIALCR